jgi:hypothetical protein
MTSASAAVGLSNPPRIRYYRSVRKIPGKFSASEKIEDTKCRNQSSQRIPTSLSRPGTYVDRMRSITTKTRAPHMVRDREARRHVFIVEGISRTSGDDRTRSQRPASRCRASCAVYGAKFDETFISGGWDPNARMADQDRDGVAAEVIYPTVGMILCNHPRLRLQEGVF